jgi:hypothetical protein
MTFDPDHVRNNLIEVLIPMDREVEIAEALADRSLKGTGDFIYDNCVQCYLVGFFDVGRELFPKARAFLRAAIDNQEIPRYYFPGGTEAARLGRLAMCEWFIDRTHDLSSLKQSVEWKERDLSKDRRPDRVAVQLSLARYVDAEEYATLIQRFEATGLKAPKNIRNIQGEGTMGYVIARNRLGLQYTSEEVDAAVNTFLKRNVPAWCDGGNYQTLSRWMKIAFWKPADDPIATLLKCYNYLPGLEPPAYP